MMRSARVLIVDDFPDAAAATQMMLELRGYECEIALSGREALEVALRFDPDIAILDIGLPDLSGYEVARALRARAAGRPLHLAAVTGWGDTKARIDAISAGFDQHILKPTDRAKIDLILREAERARPFVAPSS